MEELVDAAWDANFDRVEVLLRDGADINAVNTSGISALHAAIMNHQAEMMEFLIRRGADLEAKMGDWTPLVHAIDVECTAAELEGKLPETRLTGVLLRHGARAEAALASGEQPVEVAMQRGHYWAVWLLRLHGAKCLPGG